MAATPTATPATDPPAPPRLVSRMLPGREVAAMIRALDSHPRIFDLVKDVEGAGAGWTVEATHRPTGHVVLAALLKGGGGAPWGSGIWIVRVAENLFSARIETPAPGGAG